MASNNFIVIYDACVLYPAPIRDLLMLLATNSRLFKAKWTEDIHQEWQENLLKNRPDLKREQLERTRTLMDTAVPDALFERQRYQSLIDSLQLPDPNDRHVLAAAIACRAEIIVTFNLKDFPKTELDKYQIAALHPDDFLNDLADLNESAVIKAIDSQSNALRNPPISCKQILETLQIIGLPKIVARLTPHFL